jgi:chromosome condensin MukBEF ATPase and DNA-binding subunit MukB
MAEVQGIPAFNGPKWELQQYFATYVEDYNTATLPHKKYYDYDKWEIDEYQKQQQHEQLHLSSLGGAASARADQRQHELEQQQRTQRKRQQDIELTKTLMNTEKVQEMKQQADLRAKMQIAYKMGDTTTYERLKEKLGPEK